MAVQLCRRRRVRSRAVAALAAFATAVSLFVAVHPPAQAKPTPPPNPTDGQLHDARGNRNALAGQVAALSAKLVNLQVKVQQLNGEAELAKQKYTDARDKLEQAKKKAVRTQRAAEAAQRNVVAAQREFVEYAQAEYMSGSVQGMTGALLTAHNPNALLQQSALEGYQASHQIGAISDLQRATVAKSNADAAARQAVQARTKAKAGAEQALNDAVTAVAAAQAQSAQVKQSEKQTQTALDNARSLVAKLNGQRATYEAWKAHQEALERARKRREARERQRALERQRQLQQQQQQQHNGGGGGASYTPPPAGGNWSAAKGRQAVNRAEQYLGTMYAWAGGNAYGPTRGVCAGDGAFNDCNVIGFDCSGLVMYAWGPYLRLDHYAATQYNQAGSYHPSPGNFKPGDLLFWSTNGSVSGIHHVAIYIGNGWVIQAPESGEVIRETPWDQVGWGYFGATRPLT